MASRVDQSPVSPLPRLLDVIPAADVVVIAHAGLDQFAGFTDLVRAAPLARPITVTAWRIDASDIPPDPAPRIAWLDEQWIRVDEWIDQQLTPNPSAHPGKASL